ncbi:hypothetical protein ASPZODRAFT_136712 [Penicilliopsis zonata CBS 506.65]|uniref:Uncharacterized protein n=1 Tax=Penicilliopsis zonata CBS 506.65 TaxID=1073090 RepID=A0A1L9S7L1_9EURO|nr:hypothetical protein ASPZODRAFT_136712 [Penicilliopsis zonata CBS 506.65]OJJ43155.1 hypothetical protein ASPZODRAFT_136712 [Penicilliopsis zonata CBS 506.65]
MGWAQGSRRGLSSPENRLLSPLLYLIPFYPILSPSPRRCLLARGEAHAPPTSSKTTTTDHSDWPDTAAISTPCHLLGICCLRQAFLVSSPLLLMPFLPDCGSAAKNFPADGG